MARKLAAYDKRENVTAHPYGVNTPGGFLMVFNASRRVFTAPSARVGETRCPHRSSTRS